jgi:GR25 family glycosyltransferase involved in LPS biosynthesis
MNKLDNFPKIYCASLIECDNRRKNIQREFLNYEIQEINFLLSERQVENDPNVIGKYKFVMDLGTIGATVSHLKMIKKWYEETDEPYAFFCEDDLSLETVQYWNFTWNDFISSLPKNWDCVQLMCIGKNLNSIKLRRRCWDDWSVGAYLISRKYAKILIDSFVFGEKFSLEYPEDDYWAPLAENLIYYAPKSVADQKILYDVYTFPLFVESIEFISTFHGRTLEEKYKEDHLESYIEVLKWWKGIGKNLTSKQLLNR